MQKPKWVYNRKDWVWLFLVNAWKVSLFIGIILVGTIGWFL